MTLAEKIISGDARAASRLISLIEDGDPKARGEMKLVFPRRKPSHIVGITGPPGTGKSTLADALISLYRARGMSVGVLAVDPSSPFSGGAVLGDRIRMQKHAVDPGVFIRSMASRNWKGGLTRATAEAVQVLEAFGRDMIIVETVGVGQSEVDIARLASTTLLVCNPASGDKIQALKAGVTEIADIVVLNKADLPGAESAAHAIEMILRMGERGEWRVPCVRTVAREGTGVEELADTIERHRRYLDESGALKNKKREMSIARLRELIRERAIEEMGRAMPGNDEMKALAARIEAGETDPYTAAEQIARNLINSQ